MAAEDFPITLVISATDRATATIRAVSKVVDRIAVPAGKITARFAEVGGAMGKVGKEAGILGAKMAGMAAIGGFGLYKFMRGAVDTGDKLSEVAQRTGLTVDAFASLQYAAEQADLSQEQFTSSLDNFNKSLGQLKGGTGRFAAFLKHVSPALAEQIKHSKGTEQALGLMSKAFVKIEDPAKRAALSVAAFGDPQFAQFLGQGTVEIEKQRKAFGALAGSQELFAERAGILDNTLRDTETAFGGLTNGVATALMPAFNRLAIEVTKFIEKNRDGIIRWAERANGAFQAWANGGGFEKLIKGLGDTTDKIAAVVDKIGGFKTIAAAAAVIIAGPLLVSLVTLTNVALVPLIGTLFRLGVAMMATPLGPFLLAATGIAAAATAIYENWQPLKQFFSELWDSIGGIKGLVSDPWGAAFKGLKKITGTEETGRAKNMFGSPGYTPPTVDTMSARPTVPTQSAVPPTGSALNGTVDISVTGPKGTRVSQGKNNSPGVSVSQGVSMADSQ